MNKLSTIRFRVSNGEVLSSILQFKLVRNPAEELLCLVLIFIMSVVALKTIKAELRSQCLRIRARLYHPSFILNTNRPQPLAAFKIFVFLLLLLGAAANSEMV